MAVKVVVEMVVEVEVEVEVVVVVVVVAVVLFFVVVMIVVVVIASQATIMSHTPHPPILPLRVRLSHASAISRASSSSWARRAATFT